MAGLLVAEQVAGAAQLEVAHRDLEPGSELGVVGQRRQALRRLGRQRRGAGIQQIRVRPLRRPPHAAPDLVELREAENVGALDDQRVGLRDVDPGLDDRGADQHVCVAAQEREHPTLQLRSSICP